MLCDRNEPDIVDEYMNRTEILEYQIEYKYLPLNVRIGYGSCGWRVDRDGGV